MERGNLYTRTLGSYIYSYKLGHLPTVRQHQFDDRTCVFKLPNPLITCVEPVYLLHGYAYR